MTYTHFALIGPKHWAVLSGSKRVAKIALVNGQFDISANHASIEDLDAIRVFTKDTQRRECFFSHTV